MTSYSAEALRSVDPAKLAKRIAEQEADVARQEAVVEWLSSQLDGEERELLNLQRGLADLSDPRRRHRRAGQAVNVTRRPWTGKNGGVRVITWPTLRSFVTQRKDGE